MEMTMKNMQTTVTQEEYKKIAHYAISKEITLKDLLRVALNYYIKENSNEVSESSRKSI